MILPMNALFLWLVRKISRINLIFFYWSPSSMYNMRLCYLSLCIFEHVRPYLTLFHSIHYLLTPKPSTGSDLKMGHYKLFRFMLSFIHSYDSLHIQTFFFSVTDLAILIVVYIWYNRTVPFENWFDWWHCVDAEKRLYLRFKMVYNEEIHILQFGI